MLPAAIPTQLKFRITYDGAEVAGRPGLIVYIVPLNLGRAVEAAEAAYPIAFCHCSESADNLTAELADIAAAITKTRDVDGVEWGGVVHTVDWWQSMDLKSFWAQYRLSYNSRHGYCFGCKCTNLNHKNFADWMGLHDPGRGVGVLPIGLNHTVFCVLHAKMRVVDKLMKLLAAEAVKNGSVEHWVRVVRALGIANFKVHTQDEEGNALSPTVSSLIGCQCEVLIANYGYVVRETGVADWEQQQANYNQYGRGSLSGKLLAQLKACLRWAGVPIATSATTATCTTKYHEHYGTHPHECSTTCPNLVPSLDGKTATCPLSPLEYLYTGTLTRTLAMWAAWKEVNAVMKQVEYVSNEQLQQYEVNVATFGDTYLLLHPSTAMPCYIHIIVCHSLALIKMHGALGIFSNQGCEAAHKLIRQKVNRTARGGGKWVKEISLAVLERHYRLAVLHLLYGSEVSTTVAEELGGHEEAANEGWLELSSNFLEVADNIGQAETADYDGRITHRTDGVTSVQVGELLVTPAPRAIRGEEVHRGWLLDGPVARM
jgi:hypothetical protein